MSRSFKKSKVIKFAKSKFCKDLANRKLRKNEDVGNGSDYKKHFESWDICDCRFYYTKEDEGTFWDNPKWFRK
jgi:hypothetical protein